VSHWVANVLPWMIGVLSVAFLFAKTIKHLMR